MIKDIISERYARAFYDLARDAGSVEQAERELTCLVEMAFSEEKHKTFWENPVVPYERKMELLESILGIFQVSQGANGFLRLLVQKARFALLPEILDRIRMMIAREAGIVSVEVTSAVLLDPAEQGQVQGALERNLGKTVAMTTHVDESILGGLTVRIGNKVLDGSIRHRLRKMQDRIKRGSSR